MAFSNSKLSSFKYLPKLLAKCSKVLAADGTSIKVDSLIGLPVFNVSSLANSAAFSIIPFEIFKRKLLRSEREIFRQGPVSKALRAESNAASTSPLEAIAASAIASPLEGLTTPCLLFVSLNSPLRYKG